MREIRDLIGDPSTAEYSDEKIDRGLTRALEEYSKFHPVHEVIQISVIAGTQYYIVDDNVVSVFATSYSEITFQFDAQNPFSYQPFGDISSMYSVHPTIQSMAQDRFLIDYQYDLAQRENIFTSTLNGNQLILSPTPTESRVIYCEVGKLRTDATFPKQHEQYLIWMGAYKAAVELANKRAKFPSINIGSENLQLRDPQYLLTQAEQWKKDAAAMLGPGRYSGVQ
jgi:hypothetical protein